VDFEKVIKEQLHLWAPQRPNQTMVIKIKNGERPNEMQKGQIMGRRVKECLATTRE
jgi:hypothetical protein